MPQINDIRELAQQNARYVSNSPQDWMSYLDVAARLYRYSFTDTLLIHAQRPDATACAELELWNQKMSRWVNRGAKGIALLDDTGPRTKLRYVFDIADTHLVRGGRTPLLWNLDSHEHEQAILDHLADTYGLLQTDSMNTALMELAQQLTADNLDEAMDGLAYEVADTFLEELDEDNIRVRFRELMTNSIFYTLSRRCGQEPMNVLDDDDFIRIVDFNKLPVLSFLGNAVSEQCEAVLFDIGREMRKIYKKEITQQLEKSVDSLYNTNTDFSTLKRKTKETTTKGGQENGVDVLPQGRLSVPESGREGRAADHREVRDAAQDVPEREPQELVSEYADERQTEPASGADRGRSGEPDGIPVGQPEREVSGTEQGERPAGMGGTSEQPDSDGRRDRLEGIGVQLTEPTTEQDLSEAEEEIASAFSFPDLPTVEQQIRAIEAPIRARYADEIALDPEVVDEILRTGSNRSKGQLRLIYNFMVEKTPEEYTEFVKNEYGTGGKGFEIDGSKYAGWFDDLGLRIAVGSTAKGGTIANAFLSWEDIQVSKLKLLKANHTSQIYSLESDIARRYPREIAVTQGQIEALKTDMEAAKPLLAQDKDHFSMEISGKVYSERKEAGAAIIEACKALKAAGTEGRIGSYGAFELHSRFDNFDKVFRLSIKGAWNYSMEVGKDPQGNILRVTNALAGIERTLPQVERRLETLEQQLAQAKEEAKRPFAQEAELAEKSARLAELNSLLNMDEKGSEDALGVDEDAAETEVADKPRQPVNYAGRVAERTADNVRKPSVLAQLHAKQAERTAEPQRSQKRKSHDMEL